MRLRTANVRSFLYYILTIITLFVCTNDGYAFLHTDGKNIVDSDGNPVLLRGIGLGGWLVPEGYMLKTPGYGSPSSIRQQIIDVVGEAGAEQFYERYMQNYVDEKDIAQIASWGFNSVRLPFHYNMFSPDDQPSNFSEEGFQIIDKALDWCKKYKLYLILDMHCAPGGQNAGNISDSDGIEARLWTNVDNQALTVAIWKAIAERYTNEEWIGGYDLINETATHFTSGNNAPLRSLMMSISNTIRKVDKNHIVFIEGNWYATDFNSLTPPWETNMVYSFHKYWSENNIESIQNYIKIHNQYSVPLWLGEFGENSNPWIDDCIKLMEENNIGWCIWPHKKLSTTAGPVSAEIKPQYQKLLDYWDGRGSKPSTHEALNALMEMANSLALDRCKVNIDFIAAMTQKYDYQSEPFKSLTIPGYINCVDYDIGDIGVAYSDKDYQRTRWDANQPWNTGWEFRNDGVDIQFCDDSEGCGYNVGWTETGEWINYTVDVKKTGSYDIMCRVASAISGSRLLLKMGGHNIAVINVPNTGGWQDWKSVYTSTTVPLSVGKNVLQLVIETGGVNLNYIRFNEAGVGVATVADAPRRSFFVGPNYPNPFNNSTIIPIEVNRPTWLDIDIFDITGRRVKSLSQHIGSAGHYQIIWHGTNDQFNPVTSGLYFFNIGTGTERKIHKMVVAR